MLVRVAATSVNPVDYKRRAGLTKDFYPIKFPELMGVDVAGTVRCGRLFCRRPGVRNSQHVRRTLRRERSEFGKDSQVTRFGPGGGASARDNDPAN